MGSRVENPGKSVIFAFADYLRMKNPRAFAVSGALEALAPVQLLELPVLVETDDFVLLPMGNDKNEWFAKKAVWIKEILVR